MDRFELLFFLVSSYLLVLALLLAGLHYWFQKKNRKDFYGYGPDYCFGSAVFWPFGFAIFIFRQAGIFCFFCFDLAYSRLGTWVLGEKFKGRLWD